MQYFGVSPKTETNPIHVVAITDLQLVTFTDIVKTTRENPGKRICY
jgi:hypothetical protein